MDTSHAPLIPLRRAAFELGVPMAWLRRQADAGELPCVRAGRRRLFDLPATRAAIIRRAETHARKRGEP